MPDTDLKPIFAKLADGGTLSEAEIRAAMEAMTRAAETGVDGNAAQMGAFLMALRLRGETVEELTGAARYMRAHLKPVDLGGIDAVDIVGTGGDSHGTYNVSTCAALVAAGAGVRVAKHGNRSVSSLSGASEVLAALGVNLEVAPETIVAAVRQAGVGFMWAPMHHPAMKYWAPIRAALGQRTIFNLLGPICNPADVRRQVVGVFDKRWIEPIATTLGKLGAAHVWVVHGCDGMDELTTTGPSTVAEFKSGTLRVFDITPADAGLATATLADLKGGDPAHNAQAIRDLLEGAQSAFRDIVILNAAAAILVSGKTGNLKSAAELAAIAIDSGAAKGALDKLVALTNA